MHYLVFFQKVFTEQNTVLHGGEIRVFIQSVPDMDFAIKQARKMNSDPTINIQVEHFAVYECEKPKPIKKGMRKIYPGPEFTF